MIHWNKPPLPPGLREFAKTEQLTERRTQQLAQAWGVYFDLDDNQVRIFRPLSEEQRQKMAASLNAETSESLPS